MAIYSLQSKPLSRSSGRSVVAAAAYRAGTRLHDERQNLVHDYSRKSGVVSAEIIGPEGAMIDRAEMWNAADSAEKRKDARTGREWIIALPHELDRDQRQELANKFARHLVDRFGIAADVAIHRPDPEGDYRNHHAHILTTTRRVDRDPDGQIVIGEKVDLELSDAKLRKLGLQPARDQIAEIREAWSSMANDALERSGKDKLIDHRTLAAQGIDRLPTTHIGPTAMAMERHRGPVSDRGGHKREIESANLDKVFWQIKERLAQERLAAERERQSQLERDRIAAEQAAQARLAAERAAQAERDRLAAERERAAQAERDRIAAEQAAQARFAAERAAQAERDRLATERERQAQIERDRVRVAAERAARARNAQIERYQTAVSAEHQRGRLAVTRSALAAAIGAIGHLRDQLQTWLQRSAEKAAAERAAAERVAREREAQKAAEKLAAEAKAARDVEVAKTDRSQDDFVASIARQAKQAEREAKRKAELEALSAKISKPRPQAEPTRSAPKAQPAKPAPAQPAPQVEPEKPKARPLTPDQLAAFNAQQQGWGR